MGQRIIIKVLDLLNAACMIRQRILYHSEDKEMGIAEWQEKLLVVEFPCSGAEFIFDFVVYEDIMTVEADYNKWGTLMPRLKPLLETFKVPHRVV